jgi:hypothetical protein
LFLGIGGKIIRFDEADVGHHKSNNQHGFYRTTHLKRVKAACDYYLINVLAGLQRKGIIAVGPFTTKTACHLKGCGEPYIRPKCFLMQAYTKA